MSRQMPLVEKLAYAAMENWLLGESAERKKIIATALKIAEEKANPQHPES